MRASRGLVTHHLAASSQQLCHHDASRLSFLSRFQCWTVSCCCISFDRLLWGVCSVAQGLVGGGVLFFLVKIFLAFPQLFCATSEEEEEGKDSAAKRVLAGASRPCLGACASSSSSFCAPSDWRRQNRLCSGAFATTMHIGQNGREGSSRMCWTQVPVCMHQGQ